MASDSSIDDEAFIKAIRDSRDPFLRVCGYRLRFHSLKVDARAADARLAIRVYSVSSWGGRRVTIYRKKAVESKDPEVFVWQAIIEDLGILPETKAPPKGRTIALDEQSVIRLRNVLSANDVSSLPANGAGRFTEDGGSCTLEIVNEDTYLWRYRPDPSRLEEPLSAIVDELIRDSG